MSSPLVSIIIPCYNAEKYVGEAIASALGQSYPNVEVMVIDDGSTDGSLEVIRSFGDAVRWETGPNRGGSAARNRGIELARGKLIQFLDADDLLHPDKLQCQTRELQRTGADLVFCDGEVWPPGHPMNGMYKRCIDGEDPVVFVLRGVLQTAAPLHYRRNLLAVAGFREGLSCAQERDLHVRLACTGLGFHHLPKVFYTVRRLPGSISSDSVKVLDQHLGIVQRAYRVLAEKGTLSERRRRALAGLLATDARGYLRNGFANKAAAYFGEARRIHPDGGLPEAYSGPVRILRQVLGPAAAERLVGLKRRIFQFHLR